MKYGARNTIKVRVTEVKKGNIMSLAKFQTIGEANMASVLTTESLEHLGLKPGDEVQLIIKAINVLPVRE